MANTRDSVMTTTNDSDITTTRDSIMTTRDTTSGTPNDTTRDTTIIASQITTTKTKTVTTTLSTLLKSFQVKYPKSAILALVFYFIMKWSFLLYFSYYFTFLLVLIILPHQKSDGGLVFGLSNNDVFVSAISSSSSVSESASNGTGNYTKALAFAYLDALANTGQITTYTTTIQSTNTTIHSSNTTIQSSNTYYYTQPSLYKYGKMQWLWDSSAAAIANANRNVTLAKLEVVSLLRGQERGSGSGWIPQQLVWPAGASVSPLTQIPAIALAVEKIYQIDPDDLEFYRYVVPRIVEYLEWWRTTRDIHGTGLVSIIHPWESGFDASPCFDEVWQFTPSWSVIMDFLPLYLKFYQISLVYSWKYGGYNVSAILERRQADGWFASYGGWANWFIVEDVGVNSVYADAWLVMARLATLVYPQQGGMGVELEKVYRGNHEKTVEAIKRYLWREEEGMFGARYRHVDGEWRSSSKRCIQSLLPILLMRNGGSGNDTSTFTTSVDANTTTAGSLIVGMLEKKHVDSLIRDISDPKRFWTAYPFPSVSLDEATYTSVYRVNLMWRGPSWAFPSWMVIKGLQGAGRMDLAAVAVDRWKKGIEEQGIWEMWNAESGIGYGAKGLGMSCIIADLV